VLAMLRPPSIDNIEILSQPACPVRKCSNAANNNELHFGGAQYLKQLCEIRHRPFEDSTPFDFLIASRISSALSSIDWRFEMR
jgi:hypothetical protein